MRVRTGWPDCDPSEFGLRPSGAVVDAYWVECTPDEALRLVEPRMSDEDRGSISRMEQTYGWPHHFDGEDRCCFLVAKDMRFICAFHAHYPYHQLWNAYSPFRAVPDTTLQVLDDVSALPKPLDGHKAQT